MKVLDLIFDAPQYTLSKADKTALLTTEIHNLQQFHSIHCEKYRRIIKSHLHSNSQNELATIPYIPVNLFKELDLRSIPDGDVLKYLTSSGTTSHQVARIAVNRETSLLQTKALASIVTSFIGPKRLPMIIIDSQSVIHRHSTLSARGAGLIGMSNFGRDHFYALNDEMQLDLPGIKAFTEKYNNSPVLVFGFTFMIWQYFIGELQRIGEKISLSQGILIHGGGWKKLQDQAIGNDVFKSEIFEHCGIKRVHNFYGMVEQVGSIYMECEHNYLHAPNFADILIRDYRDWNILQPGLSGVIETISVLPRSYPGHALLTEDLGTIHGIDDCPCGRKGTRFSVEGRITRAEIRGCSDSHAFAKQTIKESKEHIIQYFPVYRTSGQIKDIIGEEIFYLSTLPAFDAKTIEFLSVISKEIFLNPTSKQYPELVAAAYWLRKSNITGYVREFMHTLKEYEIVVPRGTAFHVAPANVSTIFIYSWALSILVGNRNLIRLPQTISPQLRILLDIVYNELQNPQWDDIAARNLGISYHHDDYVNKFFSARADIRMIWGGDETVIHFRGLPAKPSTQDIIFADRVSYSLVNAEEYLNMTKIQMTKMAHLFYNDAYQFDQLACSSPRIVYFLGDPKICELASLKFWEMLACEIEQNKYDSGVGTAIDKLIFGYKSAATGITEGFSYGPPLSKLGVMRINPAAISLSRKSCGGGFFFECFVCDVAEIIVNENDQTLSYIGFTRDDMKNIGLLLSSKGLSRIVPVGQALSFSPVWDGYVLFNELTKRVLVS